MCKKNILYCAITNSRLLGEFSTLYSTCDLEITYLCESPWIMKVNYEFHNNNDTYGRARFLPASYMI